MMLSSHTRMTITVIMILILLVSCAGDEPTITLENAPPVIAGLDDQMIFEGEKFTRVFLADHVSDENHAGDQITWSHSQGENLEITDVTGSVIFKVQHEEWNGSEMVVFEACDPEGLCDNASVLFTVLPVNDPPRVTDDLVDQLIHAGERFDDIVLDHYVGDADHSVEEILWTVSGNIQLEIQISDRVVTITPPSADWIGSERIQFEGCDPEGLCDTTEAVFTVTADPSVLITYVCNEGFLITYGDIKIMIDVLFDHTKYGAFPASRVQRLEQSAPPFDDVDLVLTTHDHYDHFDPMIVGTYLEHNPHTLFVSTEEAVEAMRAKFPGFEEIEPRVTGLQLQYGETFHATPNDIELEATRIPHGGSNNLGFLVSLDEYTLLHMGDAEQMVQGVQFQQLPNGHADVIFTPHFSFPIIMLEGIEGDYLVPMHFFPGDNEHLYDWIESNYPQAVIFYEPMQSWILSH